MPGVVESEEIAKLVCCEVPKAEQGGGIYQTHILYPITPKQNTKLQTQFFAVLQSKTLPRSGLK